MNITLDTFYEKLFRRYSDTVAIQSPQTRLQYCELGRESRALANGLHEMQLMPGDRVGLLMRNRYEYFVTEIATFRAGGILVPIIDRLETDDISHIVANADVDILVVGPSYFHVAEELQANQDVNLNFVIGVVDDDNLPIGFQAYHDVIGKASNDALEVDITPGSGAIAQYTSGTTGTQKGALHTHEGIVSNIYSHISELDFRRDERMLLTTPLGHSAGYCARGVLAQGGTVILRDGFNASQVLEAIEEWEVTATFAVPTMIAELLELPELSERETDSLRTLVYGAAPIPTTTLKRGLEELGEVFVQLYGLAEVPNLVTVLPKHEHDPEMDTGLESAGYPVQLANVEIRTDVTEWDGEVGEIVVKSPYAMDKYLNTDQAERESEWIHTGDLGRIDDAGRLVVLDRIDNVILRDGEPVYSTEVEDVIQRHPAVGQVAVIGVPVDSDLVRKRTPQSRMRIDQEPKAVIVPASGNEVDTQDVIEFCHEHLSEREVPVSIDTVAKLPETPYGKIDKRTLRKPYW